MRFEEAMINGTSLTHVESVACIGTTCVLFVAINLLADAFLKSSISSLRTDPHFWRFKNTFLSWIHAIIASFLVMINIYYRSDLFSDMMFVKSRFAYFTVCVSVGYFVYDALDIIFSNKTLNSHSYEILLHHFIILGAFSIPLYTGLFIGYTIASLSIEFNTVFLHLRYMLVFQGADRSQLPFKIVSKANLISFIIFRILTLCYMTRWIVLNRQSIHILFFAVGSFGLAVMMIINIILLDRLITNDFRKKSKCKNSSSATEAAGGLSDLADGIRSSTAANTLATHSKFD